MKNRIFTLFICIFLFLLVQQAGKTLNAAVELITTEDISIIRKEYEPSLLEKISRNNPFATKELRKKTLKENIKKQLFTDWVVYAEIIKNWYLKNNSSEKPEIKALIENIDWITLQESFHFMNLLEKYTKTESTNQFLTTSPTEQIIELFKKLYHFKNKLQIHVLRPIITEHFLALLAFNNNNKNASLNKATAEKIIHTCIEKLQEAIIAAGAEENEHLLAQLEKAEKNLAECNLQQIVLYDVIDNKKAAIAAALAGGTTFTTLLLFKLGAYLTSGNSEKETIKPDPKIDDAPKIVDPPKPVVPDHIDDEEKIEKPADDDIDKEAKEKIKREEKKHEAELSMLHLSMHEIREANDKLIEKENITIEELQEKVKEYEETITQLKTSNDVNKDEWIELYKELIEILNKKIEELNKAKAPVIDPPKIDVEHKVNDEHYESEDESDDEKEENPALTPEELKEKIDSEFKEQLAGRPEEENADKANLTKYINEISDVGLQFLCKQMALDKLKENLLTTQDILDLVTKYHNETLPKIEKGSFGLLTGAVTAGGVLAATASLPIAAGLGIGAGVITYYATPEKIQKDVIRKYATNPLIENYGDTIAAKAPDIINGYNVTTQIVKDSATTAYEASKKINIRDPKNIYYLATGAVSATKAIWHFASSYFPSWGAQSTPEETHDSEKEEED